MKVIKNILMFLFIGCVFACTPGKFEFKEMDMVDMNSVKEIKLRISHNQVLADGKAQIEFLPLLISDEGYEVHDSRVDYSQISYFTSSGEELPKLFATTDAGLVGKSMEVYAKIKETELTSNTVTFTVTDPTPAEAFTEITIPVVFHLIQTNIDVDEYGGTIPMERIHLLIDKMNNVFSGVVSNNATGIDAKITFKPALYDPYGSKLYEPGINRIFLDEIDYEAGDHYNALIKENKALWPYDKYLNIWLISDREGKNPQYFYYDISRHCIPRYVYNTTDLTTVPQGMNVTEAFEDWIPQAEEVGIIYKLQSILTMVRTFGEKNENELINCVGYYLGLLPTWSKDSKVLPEDYCTDTHKYHGADEQGYQKNITPYKLVGDCFFLAENIMDDPVGVHCSITLQQALRARWVLNNCPDRSAWKSDYAFTGK